ncbi:hypothetical protein [Ferroglobus sp.]|uniref:hypothetical protein n=1 Tax=Ferroglobus sp. TaxID=2614230 RepID=UPI0025BEC1C6|nr:hypothetical protein [Ferroglobus sp.]
MKRYVVDKASRILYVKKDSIVDKHLRFEGRVRAGLFVSFWGDVEAEEVVLSPGCFVRGEIRCKNAVIGPKCRFSKVMAENKVVVFPKSVGNFVEAKEVLLKEGCFVGKVKADLIIVDGKAVVKELEGGRIIALKE